MANKVIIAQLISLIQGNIADGETYPLTNALGALLSGDLELAQFELIRYVVERSSTFNYAASHPEQISGEGKVVDGRVIGTADYYPLKEEVRVPLPKIQFAPWYDNGSGYFDSDPSHGGLIEAASLDEALEKLGDWMYPQVLTLGWECDPNQDLDHIVGRK